MAARILTFEPLRRLARRARKQLSLFASGEPAPIQTEPEAPPPCRQLSQLEYEVAQQRCSKWARSVLHWVELQIEEHHLELIHLRARDIAKHFGCTVTYAQQALRELRATGLLIRVERGGGRGKGSTYRLGYQRPGPRTTSKTHKNYQQQLEVFRPESTKAKQDSLYRRSVVSHSEYEENQSISPTD